MLQLFGHCSLQIKGSAQDLLDLIDDIERFVLRSFDGIKQSVMHIYHSALSWAPTSSPTRKLYKHELRKEAKLLNAVGTTWDACIRIIPVGEKVQDIVFSQKGTFIAARGECYVKVFDTMTGVNRATFHERTLAYPIAFSPDGEFFAAGISSRTLNIWEVQTGTLFRTFKCDRRVSSVSFSPCGTMIASGGSDGTIRIWNLLSGGCFWAFKGHTMGVNGVCWLGEKEIMSGSNDRTVRIWDVQQKLFSRTFAQYSTLVTDVASSPGSILVASADRAHGLKIHDSRSGDIIRTISSEHLTDYQLSVDGHEILLASKNSVSILDLISGSDEDVPNIRYNGDGGTFSPDGTYIASVYGKFLKIWKIQTGHKIQGASTDLRNEAIDDVYITPDERLVAFKSKNGTRWQIWDTTTNRSLFTFDDIISAAFSPTFVACLRVHFKGPNARPGCKVDIWNSQNCKLDKTIEVDDDVLGIALSSDDSRLVSLSRYRVKLWDLETKEYLAHLTFDGVLDDEAQVSFSSDGASVCVKHSGGTKWWGITPASRSNRTTPVIRNNDGTKSLPIGHSRSRTKQRMISVPIAEKSSNQDVSRPRQSYRCNEDGEWILDQNGRRVLWIPPDERPQETQMYGRKVIIQTESGKIYIVDFHCLE